MHQRTGCIPGQNEGGEGFFFSFGEAPWSWQALPAATLWTCVGVGNVAKSASALLFQEQGFGMSHKHAVERALS